MEETVEISIMCPICSKFGKVVISKDLIKNSKRGVLTINIEKDFFCPHSFIAYVDKNLSVRDCFKADYQILPP